MKGRNRKTIALEGTLLLSVVAGELTALPREVPSVTEAQLAQLEKVFHADQVATLDIEPKLVLDRICQPARPLRPKP